jgi:phosphoglycerol transferase MdoB-like AlkP superfamily enzyme
MKNWVAYFGTLFPMFASFTCCFFLVQLAFIIQHNPPSWIASILVSLSFLIVGMGLMWGIMASILYVSPVRTHKALNILLFTLLYLGLLGTVICDQYVLITHERLDDAFFLFDWNEIWMIADPGQRITGPLIFGILLLVLCPFVMYRLLKTRSIHTNWLLAILLLGSLCRVFPFPSTLTRIAENRFVYFLSTGVHYALSSNNTNKINLRDIHAIDSSLIGGHISVDPRYPLAHRMTNESILAKLLKKTATKKPPHIKIIIVESMSADLFGQRGKNTGNLMPFMDSLAKRSLYFPNGFSTYQRTHNVLPAILASVPNTIDGHVFQQLPFPRHYSLFNLLQGSYFTQFYCGVPLEYLNMIGLMSHYQTDYHVKKWNSSLIKHKNAVGNSWGFPDEDLFKQAQFDDSTRFKQLDKSSFKVFLTISSHDPFIYPNKAKWEQVVREKAKQITDHKLRAMVQRQASSFGSFAYVDSTLQAFFDKESKTEAYKNTVYLITGDHGTELYSRNLLSKYNIPLVIYSPLLKKPRTSQAIISHNDIAPTLLNYLKKEYRISLPDTVSFIGRELLLSAKFNPTRTLVFTTNKLKNSELYSNGNAWLAGSLYRVDSTLELRKVKPSSKNNWIKKQLQVYQTFSRYTNVQNHLVDSLSYAKWIGNQVVFQLDKKIFYAKLKSTSQMTYLGKYRIKKATKPHRIEVKIMQFLSSNRSLKHCPTLYLHARKNKYLSSKWTVFKNIKGRVEGRIKRNHWNEIIYSIEFTPKDLSYWKRGGSICLYLRSEGVSPVTTKNVYVRWYHNQTTIKK